MRGYSSAGRIISAIGRSSDVAYSRLFVHPGPYARVHALHRFATLPLPLLPPSRNAWSGLPAPSFASSDDNDSLEAAVAVGTDAAGRRNEYIFGYGTGATSLPWGSRFSIVASAAERAGTDPGSIDTLALLPNATAAAAGAGAGVGASLVRVYQGADAYTRSESGGARGGGSPRANPHGGLAPSMRQAAWTGVFSLDRPSELVPPSALPLAWTVLGGVGSGSGASTAAAFPLSPAIVLALAAAVLLAAVAGVHPQRLVAAGLQPATLGDSDSEGSDEDTQDDEDDEKSSMRGAEQALALRRLAAILVGGSSPVPVVDASAAAAAPAGGARKRGGGAAAKGAKAPARRGGAASSKGAEAVDARGTAPLLLPARWTRGLTKSWLRLLAKTLPLALLPAAVSSDPRATGFAWQLSAVLSGGGVCLGSRPPAGVSAADAAPSISGGASSAGAGVIASQSSLTESIAAAAKTPSALRELCAEAALAVASVMGSVPASSDSLLSGAVQLAGGLLPLLLTAAAGRAPPHAVLEQQIIQGIAVDASLVIRDLAVSLLNSAAEASLVRSVSSMAIGGAAPSPRPFASSAPPQSPMPTKSSSSAATIAGSVPQTPSGRAGADAPSIIASASVTLADRTADILATYAANIAIRETATVPAASTATARGTAASAALAASTARAAAASVHADVLAASVGPFVAPLLAASSSAGAPSAGSSSAPGSSAARTGLGAGASSVASSAWLPPATVTLRYFDPLRALLACLNAGDVGGVPASHLSAAFPKRALESFVMPPSTAEEFVRRRLPALARAFSMLRGGESSDGEEEGEGPRGDARGKKAARLIPAAGGTAAPPRPSRLSLSSLLDALLNIAPGAAHQPRFCASDDSMSRRDRGFVDGLSFDTLPDMTVVFGSQGPAASRKRSAASASKPVAAVSDKQPADGGSAVAGSLAGGVAVVSATVLAPEGATEPLCEPPVVNVSSSVSSTVSSVARWSPEERDVFLAALRVHGRDWQQVQTALPGKTPIQVRHYFQNNRVRLGLDALVRHAESAAAAAATARGAAAESGADTETADAEPPQGVAATVDASESAQAGEASELGEEGRGDAEMAVDGTDGASDSDSASAAPDRQGAHGGVREGDGDEEEGSSHSDSASAFDDGVVVDEDDNDDAGGDGGGAGGLADDDGEMRDALAPSGDEAEAESPGSDHAGDAAEDDEGEEEEAVADADAGQAYVYDDNDVEDEDEGGAEAESAAEYAYAGRKRGRVESAAAYPGEAMLAFEGEHGAATYEAEAEAEAAYDAYALQGDQEEAYEEVGDAADSDALYGDAGRAAHYVGDDCAADDDAEVASSGDYAHDARDEPSPAYGEEELPDEGAGGRTDHRATQEEEHEEREPRTDVPEALQAAAAGLGTGFVLTAYAPDADAPPC